GPSAASPPAFETRGQSSLDPDRDEPAREQDLVDVAEPDVLLLDVVHTLLLCGARLLLRQPERETGTLAKALAPARQRPALPQRKAAQRVQHVHTGTARLVDPRIDVGGPREHKPPGSWDRAKRSQH